MTAELASWCVQHGITPKIMQLPYEPDDLWHGCLADAVISREITLEKLLDYLIELVRAGQIPPPSSPARAMPTPAPLQQAHRAPVRTPIPPTVFRAPDRD
jgi:hypothetical protein